MSYRFDVFLSYSRRAGAHTWVKENFYPALRDCLDNAMRDEPTIFVDWDMESGVHWPDRLEAALQSSRLMVSVLSPPYFRSPWCLAEWRTIQARQDHLGLRGQGWQDLLIHPVVFADGRHFPDEAAQINHYDLSTWNCPMPHDSFRSVPVYRDFYREVEKFAIVLARRLEAVPPWEPDWPIVRPEPFPESRASVPRL